MVHSALSKKYLTVRNPWLLVPKNVSSSFLVRPLYLFFLAKSYWTSIFLCPLTIATKATSSKYGRLPVHWCVASRIFCSSTPASPAALQLPLIPYRIIISGTVLFLSTAILCGNLWTSYTLPHVHIFGNTNFYLN